MSVAVPYIVVIDDNEAILESVAMVLRWNTFFSDANSCIGTLKK